MFFSSKAVEHAFSTTPGGDTEASRSPDKKKRRISDEDEGITSWDGFIVFDNATSCVIAVTTTGKMKDNVVPDTNGAVYLKLDPTHFLFEKKYIVDASNDGASVSKLAQLCKEKKTGKNCVLLHCPDGKYSTALLASFMVLCRGMKDLDKTKTKIKAAALHQTPLLDFDFTFLDEIMEYFDNMPWSNDIRVEISSFLSTPSEARPNPLPAYEFSFITSPLHYILPKSAMVSSEDEVETNSRLEQSHPNVPAWLLEWPEEKDYYSRHDTVVDQDAVDLAILTMNVDAAALIAKKKDFFDTLSHDRHETPLYLAAKRNNINFVSFILHSKEGWQTILEPNNDGKTPFFASAYRGYLPVAKLLLLFGGNVSDRSLVERNFEFKGPLAHGHVGDRSRRELKRWIEVLLGLPAFDSDLQILTSIPQTKSFRTHLQAALDQIVASQDPEGHNDDETSEEAHLAELEGEDREHFLYTRIVQKAKDNLFRRNYPELHKIIYTM